MSPSRTAQHTDLQEGRHDARCFDGGDTAGRDQKHMCISIQSLVFGNELAMRHDRVKVEFRTLTS
jgi:hypothetical protein